MTHCARHFAEAVHTAKGDGRLEDLASIAKTSAELHGACRNADHRALANCLRPVDSKALCVTTAMPREEDTCDHRVLHEKICNFRGTLLSPLNPLDST